MEAFVLVQAAVGARGRDVSRLIRDVPGVVFAHDITGPYDVIAKVQAPSLDRLAREVITPIQQLDGILRMMVCPIVNL